MIQYSKEEHSLDNRNSRKHIL